MNAVLKIIFAVIFIFSSGLFENKIFHFIKKESLIKVHRGLPTLSSFSKKLTEK